MIVMGGVENRIEIVKIVINSNTRLAGTSDLHVVLMEVSIRGYNR